MLVEMTDERSTKHQTVIVLKRKYIIAQLVSFITLFLVVVFLWQYIGYVDRQREATERKKDQQLCGVFGTVDKQYQASPPPSETGRIFASDVHKLVEDLKCPNE